MSIQSSRDREDRILEEQLECGEIDTKEYNEQMSELDKDQRGYESDYGSDEPESYAHQN